MSPPHRALYPRASPVALTCSPHRPVCLSRHKSSSKAAPSLPPNRSPQCSDLSRPAFAQSPYPLMELRSAPAGGTALSKSVNTSSKGAGLAIGSHTWLPSCVRHIVSALGQQGRGPMLQLVFSSHSGSGSVQHRFESTSISQSLADNPQRWPELSSRVRSSGANGLVLVRPISSPDKHCVYAAAAAAATAVETTTTTTTRTASAVEATSASGRRLGFQSTATTLTPTPPAAPQPSSPSTGTCCSTSTPLCSDTYNECEDISNVADGSSTLRSTLLRSAAAAAAAAFPAPPASRPDDDIEIIVGQVGTCCSGESASPAPTPHHHSHHQQQQLEQQQQHGYQGQQQAQQRQEQHRPQLAATAATALAAVVPPTRSSTLPQGEVCDAGGPTQYYGLVVQGSLVSEADGCWVLKTTRSDAGGAGPGGLCTCTHFSLTRVCHGQPLYTQLRDAWLVR